MEDAMPRVGHQRPALSEGPARYVLDRLVADRRVTATDISYYLGEMQNEIHQIEERIAHLRAIAGASGTTTRQTLVPAPPSRGTQRRRSNTKGKALGGMYGGLIRRLPRDQQQQYKDIKAAHGIEAAIAALRRRKVG